MALDAQPLSGTRQVADIRAQLRKHPAPRQPDVPFSYPGPIAVDTSPPFVCAVPTRLLHIRALLGAAGTSSTVLSILVNGTSVLTVTLTSGTTNVGADLAVVLIPDTDVLTVAVTTAGTGAADLTVIARFA